MKREREVCRVIKQRSSTHACSLRQTDKQTGRRGVLAKTGTFSRQFDLHRVFTVTAMADCTQITIFRTVIKAGGDQGRPTMNKNNGLF